MLEIIKTRYIFIGCWIIGALAVILQSFIEPMIMNNITAILRKGTNDCFKVFPLIICFFFSTMLVHVVNMLLIILKRVIIFFRNSKYLHCLMCKILCSKGNLLAEQEPEEIVTRLSRDALDYIEFKVSTMIDLPLVIIGLTLTCLMMFIGAPTFVSVIGMTPQQGNIMLATIVIIMTPLHLTFLLFNKKFIQIDTEQAQANEKEIQVLTESLRAIEDIRSYNAFPFVLGRIRVVLDNARKFKTKLFSVFTVFQHIGGITWSITQVVVLSVSAWLITKEDSIFMFEDYMGFSLLCGMFNQYLSQCIEIILGWQRAVPAKQRLFKFENLNILFTKATENCTENMYGILDYRNIRYNFGKRDILCDINMKIPKGHHIAIVGPSGSGKSTFMKLAMRHLTPSEGDIFYGSQNIKDIDFQNYTSKISYVAQSPFILEGTILDNVLLGRKFDIQDVFDLIHDVALAADLIRRVLDHDASSFLDIKEKITWRDFLQYKFDSNMIDEEALMMKVANSDFYYPMLRAGLLTEVGSGGGGVSGGQAVKIALARSLISRPEILLLDEVTSALDEISQEHIVKMLHEKYKEKTIVFISHRLDIIRNMDCIYVFEGGRIIQYGKYEKLMSKKGLFREMASCEIAGKSHDESNMGTLTIPVIG